MGNTWIDCGLCNGTGKDDADFTGRCFACHGEGQVCVSDEEEAEGGEDAQLTGRMP